MFRVSDRDSSASGNHYDLTPASAYSQNKNSGNHERIAAFVDLARLELLGYRSPKKSQEIVGPCGHVRW